MDKPSFELNETDTFIFRNGKATTLKPCSNDGFLSSEGYVYTSSLFEDGAFRVFSYKAHEQDIVGVTKMVDYSKPIFIGDDEVKVLWQDGDFVFGKYTDRHVMIDKQDGKHIVLSAEACCLSPAARNKNIHWLVFNQNGSVVGNYSDKGQAVECVKSVPTKLFIVKVDISDESSYE